MHRMHRLHFSLSILAIPSTRVKAPVSQIPSHFPHFLHPRTIIDPWSFIQKLFKLRCIDRFCINHAKHVITMPRSIPEMIRGDFKCDDIAKCILGLKTIDIDSYKVLAAKGPITAERLGELLNRERSTAYRSLQNLMTCGLVHRETKTIKDGGYYYEYIALEPARLKEMVQGNIDEWYTKMKKLAANIDTDIMK